MVLDKHLIGRRANGNEKFLKHSGEFGEYRVEERIEFTRFSKVQAETIVNALNNHAVKDQEVLKKEEKGSKNDLEFFVY